jgi:putative transposase
MRTTDWIAGTGDHRRRGPDSCSRSIPIHWHIDIAYINVAGTFYYLCSVLDGCSRAIIHWEIRESMKEADVELVVERARERHPGVCPRIISDNGPQFVAKDCKSYIRLTGMTHVRTSPTTHSRTGRSSAGIRP